MRNLLILLALLCASCGTALPTIKPYKLDVQQGNVVTSKMLLQLRPGMTKSQVRFIMGTPLIQDSFHGNRWDYVYQMREAGKVIEQRRVILDFENDLLKTVRGDVIPSAGDKASAEENIGTRVINPSAKPEEKSIMNMLKFWKKDDAEIAKNKALEKAKAIEKEKLEADEAAKKAARLSLENAAPVEQTQSILAVPLEVSPLVAAPLAPVSNATLVDAPAVTPPEAKVPVVVVPVIDVPVVNVPVVNVPVVNVPMVEQPLVQVEKVVPTQVEVKSTEVAPTPANIMPVKSESYDSTAGMKFDRTLAPRADNSGAESPTASRAGNKSSPKPKDLPVESAPSFFDKMLEKIGF